MSHFPDSVLNQLADQIAGVKRPHPIRVAIDGIDAAGKTTLADALVQPVQTHHRSVIRASIDSFHAPSAVRYQRGRLSPEGYYYDSFDYTALIDCLLEPLGPGGDLRYRTAVFDYGSDTAVNTPKQTAPANAILLFDGIFLLRPELIAYWDLKIFVDVDFSTSVNRALERHRQRFGTIEGVAEPYDKRYIPGQRLYLQSCDPHTKADVVLMPGEQISGITVRQRINARPRGTVILTSGFPPTESGDVLELGAAVFEAGWNVIQYQPPGSWRSSGRFTLAGIAITLRDILAAVEEKPRILLGHSAGGLFNSAAISFGAPLEGIVSISAPNGAVMASEFQSSADFRAGWVQQFNTFIGSGLPIHSGDGRDFSGEIIEWQERLGFESLAAKLRNVSGLFIESIGDETVPGDRHLKPLQSLLVGSDCTFHALEAGHNFNKNRAALAELIIDWLNREGVE